MSRFAGGNFVKRSGDSMTGNLSMAAGSTVDGIDISEVKETKIKVGYYSGDGSDNRNIDIGINLAAKNNVLLMIKTIGTDGYSCMFRVEAGQGDNAYFFDSTVRLANTIQSLTATGFQIGSEGRVNANGKDYVYIAFWEEP